MRSCPISAPSRASSVDSCSGVGSARVKSVCCTTRPGVGSMTMVTRSIAAAAGCDSRSSSASVRSVAHVADRRRQFEPARVRLPRRRGRSRTCSTAAPRSRRSSRVDSGSSSRVSTNDSGSSPSIGHSRSSDAVEPLLRQHRHQRTQILAARERLPRRRRPAEPRGRGRRGKRGELAERFESPASVNSLERLVDGLEAEPLGPQAVRAVRLRRVSRSRAAPARRLRRRRRRP